MSGSATEPTGAVRRLESGFFERLFEGAGLAIFACDTAGRILAWNSIGQDMFRGHGACAEQAELRELLPENARAQFDDSLRTLLREREPLEFRASVARGDGQVGEYAVWLAPLPDGHGGLRGVSVWFHDITARIQLRRDLRKSERLNSLGAMSGSVSHHYANMLGGIAMSLDFAMNMNTMSAMRRSLQRTAEAVARATELTRQLQAFAQADTHHVDQADLTEMVLYYVDENESRLANLGVSIVLRREPIPIIALPREHFGIVLGNLVTNAVEAMHTGGTLEISISSVDADYVRVSISDTGTGIRPEHMERLFEPFFTTKGELSDGNRRAAGMGLAVAHGLVREMNGMITAHNNSTGGARFEVTLPIRSAY
jgi:PAS domain S-box-containing protein